MALSDAPDFDSLASLYRWIEYLSFGLSLERCRFRYLSQLRSTRHALLLGDGDGRFAARLFAQNSRIQADAVDASAAMLAALRRRVRSRCSDRMPALQTIQADLRQFAPAYAPSAHSGSDLASSDRTRNDSAKSDWGPYDLVATHFCLDCLTDQEVDALIARTLPHMDPGATWVVSEFAVPRQRALRPLGRLLIRFLYFAFGRITGLAARQIPDYATALGRHGFVREQRTELLRGLLVAELWRLPMQADEPDGR